MTFREGEILLDTSARIVVRGHYNPEEMQRRTGFQGNVVNTYWRAHNPKYTTREPIKTEKGNYVRVRRKGRGSFPVTMINIIRERRW